MPVNFVNRNDRTWQIGPFFIACWHWTHKQWNWRFWKWGVIANFGNWQLSAQIQKKDKF